MYTALWFMLKWIYDEFTSKHGNNKTFFLDSVHCDLIIFQCADQVNSGGFRQRNHSEIQSEWLCKWMHFITWLQNSCTSHPTRPDLWFVTFPAMDADDSSTQSLRAIISYHSTLLKGMKNNSLLTCTHTHRPAQHKTQTHTHTGPCSHRAQYQSESPFTHGPCNTDGLTFLEKVRDLTCSPSTELLDHTEQVWGCCALHLKDCSESETVSDNTRHSGTITFHFEHLFMRWLTLAVLSW